MDSGVIWYYGTAFEDLSDNKVIIVNPEGLKQLKNILIDSSSTIEIDNYCFSESKKSS